MSQDPDPGASPGNPADPPAGAVINGQITDVNNDPMFAELDEATRDWVEKRHETVASLAKQAHELDKFAGSAVTVPKDDASDDDWNKFYNRLGRPESAEKYELAARDDLPETAAYDADFAAAFRDKAFEMGVSQKAASGLHDWFTEAMGERAGEVQSQVAGNLQEVIDTANTALESQWGEPGSETYDAQLELSGRFFDAVDTDGGLKTKLEAAGLVGPNGEILVAELAFAFANAGAAIYTEGSTLTDGIGLAGVNPFADDTFNLTNAMVLAKNDPDQARVLMKAAGKNPADYGL